MMGVSLAACAGLRAWLPLFVVSLLAHFGKLPLGEPFQFLARTDLLIICGVATVLELLADKIPAIDNILDSVSTFVRPAAGTLLAASVITQSDPVTNAVLGLIFGGGTALTIHAGKAAARAASTALAPAHGGTANVALSVGEDVLSLGGVGLAVLLPALGFVLAIGALIFAIRVRRAALQYRERLAEVVQRFSPKSRMRNVTASATTVASETTDVGKTTN